MNLHYYDYFMIAVYFIILIVVAIFTRGIKTFNDFAVGNRTLPFSMLFASIAATYIGPGASIGFTGKGFESGFLFFFLAILFPVQSILTGIFIAPRLSLMTNASSVGDVFAEKYGRISKLASGIISVGLCLGFAAIMAMVGGKMLSSFTGMSMLLSVIIMSGVTTLYVYTGGLRASVATDVLQFSVFTIIVPILFFLALKNYPMNFDNYAETLRSLTGQGVSGLSGLTLLGLSLTFLLGEMLIPPYINRALGARSAADSKKGFVLSGIFGFGWLAIIFGLGVAALQIVPSGTAPDDVFMALAGKIMPKGLYGLLIIAILGIVMSSQDSVINAGATTAVRDIFSFFKLNKEKEFLYGKILTLVIAVLAGVLALYLPSIIDSVLITYTIWAPTVAIPLVMAMFLKKKSPWAGILSIAGGALTTIIWGIVLGQPMEIPSILVGLTGCFAGFLLGFFVDNKKEKK